MEEKFEITSAAIDLMETDADDEGNLSAESLDSIESTFGRGDKRVTLVTKGRTINELLKLVRK